MFAKRIGSGVAGAVIAGLGLALLAVGSTPAQATTTINFTGIVTSASSGNYAGLVNNQVVSGSLRYNEALVSTTGMHQYGPGSGVLISSPGAGLTNTLGSLTLTEFNEENPGVGPILKFIDGAFVGFSLTAQDHSNPYFPSWAYTAFVFPDNTLPGDGVIRAQFRLQDLGGTTRGEWVFDIQQPAPVVPIPAALPLFVSALGALGAAAARRRNKGCEKG